MMTSVGVLMVCKASVTRLAQVAERQLIADRRNARKGIAPGRCAANLRNPRTVLYGRSLLVSEAEKVARHRVEYSVVVLMLLQTERSVRDDDDYSRH